MNPVLTSKKPWLAAVLVLLFGVAVVLLAGCDLSPAEPTAPPAASTETPAPAQPTPPATGATPQAPAVITLTLWTTEAFSPTQAITRGLMVAEQVTAFEETHPDVRVQFLLKKPYGKGGILDYLVTTNAVVPELLPDLVLIDVDQLGSAVEAGLLQPLDELIPGEVQADLYPFARQAATFDGRLYGLQLWADLDHLVYNTGQMTVPPRSWPGVLSNPGPYLFPAGGQSGLVNDAFLIQYLAVAAQPAAEAEGAFLNADSLIAVLQFYQDGLSRGIFSPDVMDYHTLDECWRDYLTTDAAMTQVSAHRYLADRAGLEGSAVAAIPAINGPAAPIGRGWVLALTASDAAHQSAALDFLLQVTAPDVSAAWTRAADYLPASQAALANWDQEDGYTRFIGQQLLAARPRPSLSNYAQVAGALQTAVEGVLSGAATPEEAAAEAIESGQ